jgi:hypothetical protein
VATAVAVVETWVRGAVASLVFDPPQPEPRTARTAGVAREAVSGRIAEA